MGCTGLSVFTDRAPFRRSASCSITSAIRRSLPISVSNRLRASCSTGPLGAARRCSPVLLPGWVIPNGVFPLVLQESPSLVGVGAAVYSFSSDRGSQWGVGGIGGHHPRALPSGQSTLHEQFVSFFLNFDLPPLTPQSNAPCVLFIDEVDTICPKRETAQREMERRIVTQLLSCLDGQYPSVCSVLLLSDLL